MANINTAIVEGNLVRAAELSYWQDQTPYIKFTVANNEYFKQPDGTYKGIPSFIDCVCKGNYAKAMAPYLVKGKRITVTGRLKQQTWKSDDGQNHSRIVIKVSEISLSPSGNGQNEQTQQTQQPAQGQTFQPTESAADETQYYEASMFDDNEAIPF